VKQVTDCFIEETITMNMLDMVCSLCEGELSMLVEGAGSSLDKWRVVDTKSLVQTGRALEHFQNGGYSTSSRLKTLNPGAVVHSSTSLCSRITEIAKRPISYPA
jgi:hypothetical protein